MKVVNAFLFAVALILTITAVLNGIEHNKGAAIFGAILAGAALFSALV